MQYRQFGKLGYDVSLLGFGVMRLPRLTDADGGYYVDREKAFELLRYAADNGVNYFDTAFGYHAETAEEVLGEALDGGRRASVKIATKQPLYAMKTRGDIRRNLENTLRKLRTDHVDVYMIHGIGPRDWENVAELGVVEEFEKFRSEGMIGAVAFSYHGNYAHFKEVLESYAWDMCLVQQNMLDSDREVTDKVYRLTARHGAALAIMEPLRGGGLAGAPGIVQEIYGAYGVRRSSAEWAFRYLIDHPEISVILSGMSTLEQLKENIEIFSKPDAVPGCLTAEEKDVISWARAAYDSIVTIPCTACEYCMPCPSGVNIPGIFSFYNDAKRFEFFETRRRSYMFMTNGGKDYTRCINCGSCEPKCPQNIDIQNQLRIAHDALKGWTEVPGA